MKNCIYIIILISLTTAARCADETIARDPFWPVGYLPPPPPEPEKPEELKPVIKKPVKPEPPPPAPVTSEDWKMARKLLKINGYASGKKKENGKTIKISVVIINLKHYRTDEEIKLTHNKIDFVWTVGPIQNNSVELIHTSATRTGLATKKPPHKAVSKQSHSEALN
ncbi:MAG: hypothetical protein PF904_02620 [Kiritimatiellae bacterium]|jgi:hypothetical protein|nr:hypothetical protein [Kiritimatiellia bacterium]